MQSVTYQLSVADLVDARIYNHNSLPAVKAMRLMVFILTAGALLYAAYLAVQVRFDELAYQAWWIVLLVALTIWTLVANRLLVPASARKQLARSVALRDDIRASWDTERIVMESSHGESRWPWSDLYKWQESPGNLLLWSGSQIYHPLPKRVLTGSQLDELRAVLTATLGKPGVKRK